MTDPALTKPRRHRFRNRFTVWLVFWFFLFPITVWSVVWAFGKAALRARRTRKWQREEYARLGCLSHYMAALARELDAVVELCRLIAFGEDKEKAK